MIWHFIIIIFGLALFEIISSVDNAIINAHILKTLPEKFRKIFLFWGILFAVFVVRGCLPFLIIWISNTKLTAGQIFSSAFSNGGDISQYLDQSAPLLLLGGGIYLFLVFLSWLFMEEKKYAFLVEGFIHRQAAWFYAVASLVVVLLVYYSLRLNPILSLAAAIGTSVFFITDGFKKNSESKEKELLGSNMSFWSKIMYLEILDASFSIDGVIGAFAFTMAVPLILIGNGIGAFVVREFTIKGINVISKYAYLKNGAMYSIGLLGTLMILESFGNEFPFWLAPLNTLLLLIIFLWLSYRELQDAEKMKTNAAK